MSEPLYVNKNGFKCVRSQLAKTDGRDPVEHAAAQQRYNATPIEERDAAWAKARSDDLKQLKVRAPEFAEQP